MRKMFLFIMLFLPTIAFADVDISKCEVIGYQTSPYTEEYCKTEQVCKLDTETNQIKCTPNNKTQEECSKEVAEQQALAHKEYLIYKCPVTEYLLNQKFKEKNIGMIDGAWYYNDGVNIDKEKMVKDEENVYLFREQSFTFGAGKITKDSEFGYYIIGPANEDGLMFSFITD